MSPVSSLSIWDKKNVNRFRSMLPRSWHCTETCQEISLMAILIAILVRWFSLRISLLIGLWSSIYWAVWSNHCFSIMASYLDVGCPKFKISSFLGLDVPSGGASWSKFNMNLLPFSSFSLSLCCFSSTLCFSDSSICICSLWYSDRGYFNGLCRFWTSLIGLKERPFGLLISLTFRSLSGVISIFNISCILSDLRYPSPVFSSSTWRLMSDSNEGRNGTSELFCVSNCMFYLLRALDEYSIVLSGVSACLISVNFVLSYISVRKGRLVSDLYLCLNGVGFWSTPLVLLSIVFLWIES